MKFFLDVAASVNDSRGYLLHVSNFVFNPEYVFINPETLEPALVYVPAAIEGKGCGALQDFISDLLLQHIHVEGFDSGNLVQRILSAVKCDTFNLGSFIALMNELLYSREQKTEIDGPVIDTPKDDIWKESQITGKKEKVQEKTGDKGGRSKTAPVFAALALLLQLAMGSIIYLCRGFLDNAGKNPAVTYAAVIMIVAAVDVLLFKKLSPLKLAGVKETMADGGKLTVKAACAEAASSSAGTGMQHGRNGACISDVQIDAGMCNVRNAKAGNTRNVKESSAWAAKGDNTCEKAGKSLAQPMDGAAEESREGASSKDSTGAMIPEIPNSCKTELLRHCPKGMRILKSTGRRSGDEDIIIDKDEFIIGRLAGHVDYVINNNAVGKLHAELIFRNGACFVRDLNSMNGTYINDVRIESNKEYELKENDKLQLANSEFVLVMS